LYPKFLKQMKKKSLGKGLRALIPAYEVGNDRYLDGAISLSKIIPNPNQPRQKFHKEGMEELINSIRENGILQPLTVRETEDGHFELIAGERRFRAAKKLELETVPVYAISVKTDVQMLEYALVENVQREDLDPIEEAEGYALLSGKYNLSQADIAKKVGKNRVTVTNSMRLLKLPSEVKAHIRAGDVSSGHGRALLALKSTTLIKNMLHRIIKDQLSVRQTEDLVKSQATVKKKKPLTQKKNTLSYKKPSALLWFEKDLRSTLATKVSISRAKEGDGRIEIEFYSNEDLERLIELITGNTNHN